MSAKELVEYVAKSLVDDPSAVTVDVVEEDGATVIGNGVNGSFRLALTVAP